jgi:multiple RNA-binding domain-containing protein 1
MGHGFAEYESTISAQRALNTLQGYILDGKPLSVSWSTSRRSVDAPIAGAATNRLCVKNLAFEASRSDVKKLFDSYANVVAVRLPRKVGENQHRGFAFVELSTKADATRAMEALQNTHLYGRKLVIESAESETVSLEDLRLSTGKRVALRKGALVSESKKRKISAYID